MQRPNKSGFIQGPPGVVSIRLMYHVCIHSLIMWRYFEYFISFQPLGVSRETLEKDQTEARIQLQLILRFQPAVCTHSSAADTVTSLTEVLI